MNIDNLDEPVALPVETPREESLHEETIHDVATPVDDTVRTEYLELFSKVGGDIEKLTDVCAQIGSAPHDQERVAALCRWAAGAQSHIEDIYNLLTMMHDVFSESK